MCVFLNIISYNQRKKTGYPAKKGNLRTRIINHLRFVGWSSKSWYLPVDKNHAGTHVWDPQNGMHCVRKSRVSGLLVMITHKNGYLPTWANIIQYLYHGLWSQYSVPVGSVKREPWKVIHMFDDTNLTQASISTCWWQESENTLFHTFSHKKTNSVIFFYR